MNITRFSIKKDLGLKALVDLQIEADRLPKISSIEKAKFDQNLAIDQLYYSSKLEGSNLTTSDLQKVMYGTIQ